MKKFKFKTGNIIEAPDGDVVEVLQIDGNYFTARIIKSPEHGYNIGETIDGYKTSYTKWKLSKKYNSKLYKVINKG